MSQPRRIKQRKIGELRPYESNTKTHPQDQIALIQRSIEEYGWTVPVLIDENDVIVAGHARVEAAKAMGMESVPTILLDDLTPDQIRAYRIADNRLTELGGWDTDLLRTELEALDAANFDIELTGFTRETFGQLGQGTESQAKDPDEAPDPPAEPRTRAGDLWIMGRHRLVCGDSTDGAVVARVLGGAVPNVMVTDPPYGVNYDPEWRVDVQARTTGRRGSEEIDDSKFAPNVLGPVHNDDRCDWTGAYDLFPGNVAYVWSPSGPNVIVFGENLVSAKLMPRNMIIWVKPHFVFGRGHYHLQHEICWYSVRKGATADWVGDRTQTSVWEIAGMGPFGRSRDEADVKSGEHSTQKPVECMERPLRNHKGDVYDPFCGSGTSVIAAERLRRRCYAVELDARYCDVIVDRWQSFTGETAIREAGPDTQEETSE